MGIVQRVETWVFEEATGEPADADLLSNSLRELIQPRSCVLELACDVGLKLLGSKVKVKVSVARIDRIPCAVKSRFAPVGLWVKGDRLLLEKRSVDSQVLGAR